MRAAHEIADKHEDVATASILENFIDAAEKRNWFLFEASRTGDGQRRTLVLCDKQKGPASSRRPFFMSGMTGSVRGRGARRPAASNAPSRQISPGLQHLEALRIVADLGVAAAQRARHSR